MRLSHILTMRLLASFIGHTFRADRRGRIGLRGVSLSLGGVQPVPASAGCRLSWHRRPDRSVSGGTIQSIFLALPAHS
jgi:hypothetical protein